MFPLLMAVAHATVSSPPGGLEIEVDGRVHLVPSLKTDVDARVDGDLATVRLVQTFRNPTDRPMNARYLFPLPEDAAVYDLTLQTDAGAVRADIARREDAAKVYADAAAQGKKAALLDQERPNVFTQRVANLGPGEEVRIELLYAHAVPLQDSKYVLTVPLVVGPRYVSPDRAEGPGPDKLAEGQWVVQSTDRPSNPSQIDPGRVGLTVHLGTRRPVTSPSHPVALSHGDEVTVRLAEGRALDNQDFVLTWSAAEDRAAVSSAAWGTSGRGVVSLLIEPPASPPAAEITPRELVFVLDTSCSMKGFPLDTTKRFMRRALQDLRPGDQFRIVRFSSRATEFADHPVPADPESIPRALAWVDALAAGGGTEVGRGLERAFGPETHDDRLRLVVLLSDGYIGNEVDVIRQIDRDRRDARVFALGTGSSVNRYLIDEVARAGRGVARIVLSADGADEAADLLAERLEAPYLTDVTIDWGEANVREVSPRHLPDLFLGEPLRVLARYDRPGQFPIVVRGRIAGQPAALGVTLSLPADDERASALPITWARAQIDDRMIDWMAPNNTAADRARIQEEVTVLGLEYRQSTRWTSFVAVGDDAPQTSVAMDTTVATPLPSGMAGGAEFSGSSAPEPATWLAAMVALGVGGWASRYGRGRAPVG